MSNMPTEGLSLDQAPPLSVPMSFFLTAPLALVVAGGALVAGGGGYLQARWATETMALAHLGTLGFFAMVMVGALYQMIPVVGGAPVPWVRSAHVVHGCLIVGLAMLAWGFFTGVPQRFVVALPLLAVAFTCFIGPIAVALIRAPTKSATVRGMRLAVLGLLTVVSIGVVMGLGRAGLYYVDEYGAWLFAHVAIGLVVWIGGLIVSVSFQIVPMFYLTADFPRAFSIAWTPIAAFALLVPLVAIAVEVELEWVIAGMAPAAVALWVVAPLLTARLLRSRRRRRVGESVRFWWGGVICAPLVLLAGIGAYALDEPRWTVLFGWLALFGWAGLIVHGMLTRIAPFLVWFHRCAPLVGRQWVPSMKELLPDRRARVGLIAHVATLVAGTAAIISGSSWLGLTTGVGLVLTGGALATTLVRTLGGQRAPS